MEADLPLVDLHLHQERSARVNQVLASQGDQERTDWAEWRSKLESVPEGIERLRRLWNNTSVRSDIEEPEVTVARLRILLEEAAASGAVLAEIRVGNDTVVRNDFLDHFAEAVIAVQAQYPRFEAGLIVTLKSWFEPNELREAMRRCIAAGSEAVSGVDFLYVPYDAAADLTGVQALADRAASAGLGVTAHGGEFSAHNIRAILKLPGISRIGHATHILDDPEMLEVLMDTDVAVEICLTSNVVLGAVHSLETHPILSLWSAGLPIVLGTDNPLQFGTDIATEYALAESLGLSRDDLRTISRTAVKRAFIPEAVRDRLMALPDLTGLASR